MMSRISLLLYGLAVFLGFKARWGWLFALGLVVDLSLAARLGITSGLYLLIGGVAFYLKRFLPLKRGEIKLKI